MRKLVLLIFAVFAYAEAASDSAICPDVFDRRLQSEELQSCLDQCYHHFTDSPTTSPIRRRRTTASPTALQSSEPTPGKPSKRTSKPSSTLLPSQTADFLSGGTKEPTQRPSRLVHPYYDSTSVSSIPFTRAPTPRSWPTRSPTDPPDPQLCKQTLAPTPTPDVTDPTPDPTRRRRPTAYPTARPSSEPTPRPSQTADFLSGVTRKPTDRPSR